MDGLERCPFCGGDIGVGGYCLKCGRKAGDDDSEVWLHGIVGGLTALTTIGVGLALVRVFQGSRAWRNRDK